MPTAGALADQGRWWATTPISWSTGTSTTPTCAATAACSARSAGTRGSQAPIRSPSRRSREGARGCGTGRHGDPHRGRGEPGSSLRRLSGRWWPASESGADGSHQGLHRLGDRLLRPGRGGDGGGGAARPQGRRVWAACRAAARRSCGAEVRGQVCPAKISGERWLEIHQSLTGWASRPTPPCSTATWRPTTDRVDHLLRLREAQDETGRLPGLHPPGLPAQEQRPRAPSRHHRAPTI